jgi:hypothetical protein
MSVWGTMQGQPVLVQYIIYVADSVVLMTHTHTFTCERDERMGHDAGPASFGTIHHLRS